MQLGHFLKTCVKVSFRLKPAGRINHSASQGLKKYFKLDFRIIEMYTGNCCCYLDIHRQRFTGGNYAHLHPNILISTHWWLMEFSVGERIVLCDVEDESPTAKGVV